MNVLPEICALHSIIQTGIFEYYYIICLSTVCCVLCTVCEWNFDMKYYTDVVEYYYIIRLSIVLCVLCEWNFDMKYYTDVVEYCLCETHFNFEIRMVILTAKM